jgi:ribosomal protein S18 acetylase RimI-like enzyme
MKNISDTFKVRPPTIDDADSITGLIQASSLEFGMDSRDTVGNIRALMSMPGINLENDTMLVVDKRDQILGCALIQENPPSPLLSAMVEVHPQHKGKGVGTLICQWIEERARQAIPRLPADVRVVILQKKLSEDSTSRDLLSGHGYHVVRHNFRMVIDLEEPLPHPKQPEGIIIRPFVRNDEGYVLVQKIQETFRHNWGYVERPLEVEFEQWMYILDQDDAGDNPQHWLVAVDGNDIVGFALSRLNLSDDPEEAGINILGVQPEWRRRGIALALLQHTFWKLQQQGKRRIRLEVDTQNVTGATRLYEKAGMGIDSRYDFFEKEIRSGVN